MRSERIWMSIPSGTTSTSLSLGVVQRRLDPACVDVPAELDYSHRRLTVDRDRHRVDPIGDPRLAEPLADLVDLAQRQLNERPPIPLGRDDEPISRACIDHDFLRRFFLGDYDADLKPE